MHRAYSMLLIVSHFLLLSGELEIACFSPASSVRRGRDNPTNSYQTVVHRRYLSFVHDLLAWAASLRIYPHFTLDIFGQVSDR